MAAEQYTTAEIIRWLQRLDAGLSDLLKEQRDSRKEQLKWIWGILAAIVIFGVTTLLRGGG
jgi:hypothetical protein